MSSRFLPGVIPLVSLFILRVWAQSEMAQCPAGWEWNRNSLNQDPCTIGSLMDASCRGRGLFPYQPLNSTQHYSPPNNPEDLRCDCNTVIYNLYMACTSCQGGNTYSWASWRQNFRSVNISQYGPADIPQGTVVPYWAYFDFTAAPGQIYNDTTASEIGRNPEVRPPPPTPTPSPINPRTSTGGQPNPTNDSNNTDNDSNGGTNVGAIVGGVVGSIVPLTILAVAVFFYVRHRRQQQAQQQIQIPDGQYTSSTHGPSMTSVPFTLYNPSDPKTFPLQ